MGDPRIAAGRAASSIATRKTGAIVRNESRTIVVSGSGMSEAVDIFKAHTREVAAIAKGLDLNAYGKRYVAQISGASSIEPPFDLYGLARIAIESNCLRQNIDAYQTNIDGFGHRLEPVVDLDSADGVAEVRRALIFERERKVLREEPERDLLTEPVDAPSDQEVSAAVEGLRRKMERERRAAVEFFKYACLETSFVELRQQMRGDVETSGQGGWELIRNKAGIPARLVYVKGIDILLRRLEDEDRVVKFTDRRPASLFRSKEVETVRMFRRFAVRQGSGNVVWFKSYGDPRHVDRATGDVFEDRDAAEKKLSRKSLPAHELVFFRLHNLAWPGGLPRWLGNLLSVFGSKEMEQVNLLYFKGKSVPPLAILVSGGKLAKGAVEKIREFIEKKMKGIDAFHKVLILEAMPAKQRVGDKPGKVTIEIVPLTSAQLADQLFGKYDQANRDKVGESFRLPRIVRAISTDFNRATADAALRFAEEQVFQPIRDSFDHFVNRWLMPELGVWLWEFRSNSPVSRDPETMSKAVERLVKAGVLVPSEGRELSGDIFNREFSRLPDKWVHQPLSMTLAGVGAVDAPGGSRGDQMSSGEVSDDEFEEEKRDGGLGEFRGERDLLLVPAPEFDEWVEPGDGDSDEAIG